MKKKKSIFTLQNFIIFVLPCLAWVFLFRRYITGEFTLLNDAVPYFEHVKFYLDNISKGIFPLWDPTRNEGIPNEFYLRRIGEINPFYFIIIIYQKLGLSFRQAYLLFLTKYFFLGVFGFYFLSKKIFNNRITAYVATLLLMFSSIGTKVFESYLILLFTPIVLFFYFLVSFFKKQERFFFLGVIFSTMLLMSTYLPFYFFTILLVFIVCFGLLFFREHKSIGLKLLKFIKGNKIFTCLCVAVLILSLLPGGLFFLDIGKNEISIPKRHMDSPVKHEIGVNMARATEGGLMAPIIAERFSSNLDAFILGREYIPCFAFLLLLLGCIVTVSRRMILFSSICFICFLISLTDATPVYPFLYKWIPYFKYFRNFSHFFWLVILPLFILFVSEMLQRFFDCPINSKKDKILYVLFVVALHVGYVYYLFSRDNIVLSVYVVVLLSLVFFVSYVLGFFKNKSPLIMMICFFVVIVVNPMQVYFFLNQNSEKRIKAYRYENKYYLKYFKLHSKEVIEKIKKESRDFKKGGDIKPPPPIYYGSRWFSILQNNVLNDSKLFSLYLSSPLIIYDNIRIVEEGSFSFSEFEKSLLSEQNAAFVSVKSLVDVPQQRLEKVKGIPEIVSKETDRVKIEYLDVNSLRLKTDFRQRKFIVYNDCYSGGWQAFINGKEIEVFRANYAFKGFWVPSGEHTVFLRYGELWRYLLKFFLIGIFHLVLYILMFYGIRYYGSNKILD